MRYKVLWIEDNAEADLFHLTAPVNVDGSFNMDIAVNATEGIDYLNRNHYDVIIVDTRIPPGDDHYWQARERKIKQLDDNPIVRLGVEILNAIFDTDQSNELRIHPQNRELNKFCIFSIDPRRELAALYPHVFEGIQYEQKVTNMPRNILVTVIRRILKATRNP